MFAVDGASEWALEVCIRRLGLGPDVRFSGKERDAETGLDYFGVRYFSSAQGRMTSPDAPFADQHALDVYRFGYTSHMRPVRFLGNSLGSLRNFPEDARHDAGYQLEKVQRGEQPTDFKPMPSIARVLRRFGLRKTVARTA